jgi:hypothetical protein
MRTLGRLARVVRAGSVGSRSTVTTSSPRSGSSSCVGVLSLLTRAQSDGGASVCLSSLVSHNHTPQQRVHQATATGHLLMDWDTEGVFSCLAKNFTVLHRMFYGILEEVFGY